MLREIEIPRNEVLETLSDPSKVTGFVSPAEDYLNKRLHISQRIVRDPVNTYYFEADDDQMKFFGITKGSIVVVDKSIKPVSGSMVVCFVDTEFLTRKLILKGTNRFLCVNETNDGVINITNKDVTIFGVVTWACSPHHLK
ncbi:DNA polymerase V subunit UmuD [compost metagenome]